ncbi:MAG TPA: hypothetical protein PLS53_06860 [Thermoanaerobaculaceae bacterium]|nr:hypothetical protein [Thermoanaerobaculaceae bacterium]HPS77855.1 hypothetical protein [Thermoanaerobaculaceae bacterium]
MSGPRGLVVLADGIQSAFAAGAAASLARAGAVWSEAMGAGLGAQVAALALLGEAEEAGRRWKRQGELGCLLLTPVMATARRRLGDAAVTALPDAWRIPGWLDEGVLGEHLAPEAAALPARLQRLGKHLQVVILNLTAGTSQAVPLENADAARAAHILDAAARFPGGWGPASSLSGTSPELLWGGIAAVASGTLPGAGKWDLVCGFPVPPLPRPGLSTSIWETIQRRDEQQVGSLVTDWVRAAATGCRVVAPTEADLRSVSGRPDTELAVEYPLPWERNGELCSLLVRMGEAAAARALVTRSD